MKESKELVWAELRKGLRVQITSHVRVLRTRGHNMGRVYRDVFECQVARKRISKRIEVRAMEHFGFNKLCANIHRSTAR
jgi:hypothetical protein